jgi:hypothetical protein
LQELLEKAHNVEVKKTRIERKIYNSLDAKFKLLDAATLQENVLVLHIIFFYELLCLMPLSTIFQLYCGSFIGGGSRSTPRETTNLPQVADKRLHINLYQVQFAMRGIAVTCIEKSPFSCPVVEDFI